MKIALLSYDDLEKDSPFSEISTAYLLAIISNMRKKVLLSMRTLQIKMS